MRLSLSETSTTILGFKRLETSKTILCFKGLETSVGRLESQNRRDRPPGHRDCFGESVTMPREVYNPLKNSKSNDYEPLLPE
ncbi:MAG: hypothetical protein IKB98_07900 [Clostridia bacterium]|nr:hypothetical protein [Clostridia bacterium]